MSVQDSNIKSKGDELVDGMTKKVEQPLTIIWEKLHPWQQDNQFIRTGYRPASNSYYKSAASLGYLHNESVNIYTHLIGALVFGGGMFVMWAILKPRYPVASPQDVFAFGCFFAGAIGCLSMSATYHLLGNHSESVHKWTGKLDYLGIVVLIWGSFIPSIYYGFACNQTLINTYWAMITTIGAGCVAVITYPKVGTPAWRPLRAGMFLAMGLSAVIPVLHGLQLYGLTRMTELIGLPWLVTQGALYVIGALIYANRVPEVFSPGAFDIWGSSHQIFHVLVVLAAAAHLVGLVKAFDYHHSYSMLFRCSFQF